MWHLRLLPRVRQTFAAVWSRVTAEHSGTSQVAAATASNPEYGLRSRADEGTDGEHEAQSDAKSRVRPEVLGGKRRRNEGHKSAIKAKCKTNSGDETIEDDLLVSFDGASVYRPWRHPQSSACQQPTTGGWYHVDQNFWNVGRQDLACVQALVTLTDVHEGTGGLVLFPGSHHHFARLSKLKRVKGEYQDKSEDYVRFEDKDLERVLGKRGKCNMLPSLVRARAGDMILWDSRVVHSGTPAWFTGKGANPSNKTHVQKIASVGGKTFPALAEWQEPTDELLRIAGYVCMMPARLIPASRREHILEVRQRIFQRGWATTHWPLEPMLGAKEDKPEQERPAPSNAPQRRLIGFR